MGDAILLCCTPGLAFVNEERRIQLACLGKRFTFAQVESLWELVHERAVTHRYPHNPRGVLNVFSSQFPRATDHDVCIDRLRDSESTDDPTQEIETVCACEGQNGT
jgi:hypothetical protein